jgi:hypothetical protein
MVDGTARPVRADHESVWFGSEVVDELDELRSVELSSFFGRWVDGDYPGVCGQRWLPWRVLDWVESWRFVGLGESGDPVDR